MNPEQRVNLALDMSSTASALVLDSIRDRNPGISKSELFELARKRMRARTTSQQHVDDIRAILANTKVNKRRILDRARRDGTVEIFQEILESTRIRKTGRSPVKPDKKTVKRLKTGDKELKTHGYKVASSWKDVDRILY